MKNWFESLLSKNGGVVSDPRIQENEKKQERESLTEKKNDVKMIYK